MFRHWFQLFVCSGMGCLLLGGQVLGQGPSQSEVESQRRRAQDLAKKRAFAEAAALYEEILPAAEIAYGKESKSTAQVLNDLGLMYFNLEQHAKAEPYFQRSLHTFETNGSKESYDVAVVLNNLAQSYHRMGEYAEAERLFERSLRIYKANLGEDHLDQVPALTNLANLYRTMGKYGKAEPLLRRGLQIREAKLPADDPKLALSAYHLASYHVYVGEYADALPLFQRSLKIFESKLGSDHPDVAFALFGLAHLHAKMGENEKAERLYQRSLQILENKRGENHADVATALNNLAELYHDTGDFAKAERHFQRSLQIYEAKLGKVHPHVATALSNLARLYDSMGQYAKAQPHYERCLQINQAKLYEGHRNVDRALHNVARNAASQQEWAKAVDYFQKARQGTASHLATTLPILSEKEQLTLLQANFEIAFHRALSLGWSARAAASAPSAEWLLNGKAIAHQSLAEQKILAREAQDPNAKQLVESLQRARAHLAALVNILPKTGREAEYQQEMHDLRTSERDLAQKLARAVGRTYRANPWISLEQLRAKLGPKAAFIDIARFSLFDFNGNKKRGQRYVAWITPPGGKGDVQLIDLGEAEPIDQLVGQTRKTLLDTRRSLSDVGDSETWEALQKPLKELSAKVLHPLLRAVEKYDEWIICPDGALWLTPWSALLLPDGKFCVEKHLIRHVVSGRDLVLELPKGKTESAYIFADPDYDLSPSKVTAAAGDLRGGFAEEGRAAGSLGTVLRKVPRLPGTAAEAKAVLPKLKQWLGQEPKVFLEEKASETMVRAVKNPRILILATHGYFLPRQEAESKERASQLIDNPLLRCGLLLAGCNKRTEAKLGEDDGILTGLEIVGLNLNGCELVVLSACETGLGDLRSGEGVAGLRQAFQLAGAKGVLASLWQVDDRETALLMSAFYKELANGRNQTTALRQAQLERIAAWRAEFGVAHPFFWSAFALTSRGAD